MTRKTGSKAAQKQKRAEVPPMYYRLHALLETIRAIKGYEDPLCSLLHTIQTTGAASPEVEGELEELLDAMPSYAYAEELAALREVLDTQAVDA